MAAVDLYLPNYEICEVLGKGAYGVVHRARGPDGDVAIKSLGNSERLSGPARLEACQRAQAEAEVLMACAHKNVVAIHETNVTPTDFHIIMELCKGGDLLNYVRDRRRLSELEARKIFMQLIFAVDHVHRQGFVHRDLKCENILIADGEAQRIVLADFGFAGRWSRGVLQTTSLGSLHYASPEICMGTPYEGPEVDVWSLGVILFALVTGSLPFHGKDEIEIFEKIRSATFSIPSHVSAGCAALIRAMLTAEPLHRVNIDQIKRDSWFAGLASTLVNRPSAAPASKMGKRRSMTLKEPISANEAMRAAVAAAAATNAATAAAAAAAVKPTTRRAPSAPRQGRRESIAVAEGAAKVVVVPDRASPNASPTRSRPEIEGTDSSQASATISRHATSNGGHKFSLSRLMRKVLHMAE